MEMLNLSKQASTISIWFFCNLNRIFRSQRIPLALFSCFEDHRLEICPKNSIMIFWDPKTNLWWQTHSLLHSQLSPFFKIRFSFVPCCIFSPLVEFNFNNWLLCWIFHQCKVYNVCTLCYKQNCPYRKCSA